MSCFNRHRDWTIHSHLGMAHGSVHCMKKSFFSIIVLTFALLVSFGDSAGFATCTGSKPYLNPATHVRTASIASTAPRKAEDAASAAANPSTQESQLLRNY